ncbi:MAG: hypothetical protein IJU23_12600 [Proteobacteria bacterium]|nr:hypothetical protein [Pseudomonadota bacterium]
MFPAECLHRFRRILRRNFLLIILSYLLVPGLVFAADDPSTVWQELESEHFVIVFPSERIAFARRALGIAEEAHLILTKELEWVPKTKTYISVTDYTDTANGWATSVPRNEIRLQAYPPFLSEELGFYDDWMRQLIYHEYTHILHTDTSYGLHPVLNVIFGKFARNNATLPHWFTEGMAVYYETQMSNTGRLRNVLYKTMIRNAALAEAIPTLGEMSAGLVRWPESTGNYLFGAFFIDYIANTYGRQTLTAWIKEYGDDWIPYAMNRAALRVWHKTWDELYEEWRSSEIEKARNSVDSSETPHESLFEPWRHGNPEVHGEWLTYVKRDLSSPRAIVRKSLKTGIEEHIADCWGQCNHQWNHKGDVLYFMHSPAKDGFQQYETLYTYHSETKKIEHLNVHGRIRRFCVDENDDLYRIVQDGDNTEIWKFNGASDELMYRSEPFEQIEDIVVKSGNIISVIFNPKKQQADLYQYQNGEWIAITDSKSTELAPFWMRDNRLGYVASKSGELNLWAYSPETGIHTRLTNLYDGILSPSESDDGDIYYTQYTANGTTIARILAKDLEEHEDDVVEAEPKIHFPDLEDVSLSSVRRYKPWQWMWPQNWIPQGGLSGNGGFAGISIEGSDLLDHHVYSLSVSYLIPKSAFEFSFSYDWKSLIWDLGLRAGLKQNTASYIDGIKTKQFDYQTVYGDIIASRIWNGRVWTQSVTLTAHLEYNEAEDPLSWTQRDPAARIWLPSLGWHNSLSASWSWSNLRQTEHAFAPNHGYAVSASIRFEAPWLGDDAYTFIGNATAKAGWTMPWFDSHVISLLLSGGGSWSQNENRLPFSLSSAQGVMIGSSDVMMHGYPAGLLYGKHFLYGHASYSAPIWNMEAGYSTLPIGIRRLGAAAFGDWGYAWGDEWNILHSKVAIGAELYIDLLLGYRLPARITVGYAWGAATQGNHDFYIFWTL